MCYNQRIFNISTRNFCFQIQLFSIGSTFIKARNETANLGCATTAEKTSSQDDSTTCFAEEATKTQRNSMINDFMSRALSKKNDILVKRECWRTTNKLLRGASSILAPMKMMHRKAVKIVVGGVKRLVNYGPCIVVNYQQVLHNPSLRLWIRKQSSNHLHVNHSLNSNQIQSNWKSHPTQKATVCLISTPISIDSKNFTGWLKTWYHS